MTLSLTKSEWGVLPLNVLPTNSPSSFYREYEAVLTPDQTMRIITRLQHQPLTCCTPALSLSLVGRPRGLAPQHQLLPGLVPNKVYIYSVKVRSAAAVGAPVTGQ